MILHLQASVPPIAHSQNMQIHETLSIQSKRDNQLTVNNAPVNEYKAQNLDMQSNRVDIAAQSPRVAKARLCPVRAIVI